MELSLIISLIWCMMPSYTDAQTSVMKGDVNWANKFNPTDESKALATLDKNMDKKIEDAMRRSEMAMVKSKKKTSYLTISQDVHLGQADAVVDIQKLAIFERLARFAANYPWVSLRKMTVMWKTGVSNNVRWSVKMSFVDRRDQNEETRELFMMEYPVSDNFIMMMSPGYTAYMGKMKAKLPWRFDFDFPDGEFSSDTIFGTLKIKMEVDQYREATQTPEIVPMVKFTRVTPSVTEPTLRWMSKGKWYQSSATVPEPVQLETISSAMEDLATKYNKFLSFLGFDVHKISTLPCASSMHRWIDSSDLQLFENNPLLFAKSYQVTQDKYKEKLRKEMTSSVYVN
ncbi:TPA_asm: P2 [Alnus trirhavirus 1]|nr:TPA_asm: P2 [Alnus trirhavirus 1]